MTWGIGKGSWVGQYCICVTDLVRAEKLYGEIFGLAVDQRIEIDEASEVVLWNPECGGKIQLAKHRDVDGPIDHGNAQWKLYIYNDDCEGLHKAAVAFGCKEISKPQRLDRWPVTVSFVEDHDGYLIELIQRHP